MDFGADGLELWAVTCSPSLVQTVLKNIGGLPAAIGPHDQFCKNEGL